MTWDFRFIFSKTSKNISINYKRKKWIAKPYDLQQKKYYKNICDADTISYNICIHNIKYQTVYFL